MKILKLILILLVVAFICLLKLSKKYANPYKLIFIFGKKGSGKTTYLTKQSIKYSQKGWKVFSNVELFNTYKLDPNWLGRYDFPEKSLIICDEVSMIWSNRDFKNFPKHIEAFFRLQRHDKIYVMMASQSFDVDKKIRDLSDSMYLLKNAFNCITVAKKIDKYQDVHNTSDNDKDNQSGLVEMYRFAPFWEWDLTFNPRYFRFFNSFEKVPKPRAPMVKYQFENYDSMIHLMQFKYWLKTTFKDYRALKKYERYLDSLSFKCSLKRLKMLNVIN